MPADASRCVPGSINIATWLYLLCTPSRLSVTVMPALEALSVLTTVLSTARSIHTWLDQVQSKKEKVERLKRTVTMLIMVLEPLRGPDVHLDKGSVALFLDLAEILNSIRERLSLCSEGTLRFAAVVQLINPSVILGALADDEKKLSMWMELFMLSLQINQMKQKLADRNEGEVQSPCKEVPNNGDASLFWERSIGLDTDLATSAEFMTALKCWVQEELEEVICSALLVSLDKQDIGGVTRKNLVNFAGQRTLKECVSDLKAQCGAISPCSTVCSPLSNKVMEIETASTLVRPLSSPSTPSTTYTQSSINLEPTLIWIDDKMENNTLEVAYAKSRGIRVVQLPSTAAAKMWVEKNEFDLRVLENSNMLHIITDNARWEMDGPNLEGDKVSLNLSAGETIMKFLRGYGFMAPVLVYCGESVIFTEYVKTYSNAGSTRYGHVCQAFINELASSGSGQGGRGPEFWSSNFGFRRGCNIQSFR
ncbi:hypothetical protein AMATHDRAFT_68635 [Amanita thiersii Skay4041]|uniref:Uncharacterized protein n=1 Tax=Amanita thiersii Skay4041 TaxID=703135 RepID=A0A2A9NGY2_9AGAR|nr:hypothetical protein AMATHDRAFT_68635 [Amanita thiersii Skay4041]